jgi:YbgC/YbaW family acyl-CoA thioester hydrolase
MDLRSMMASQQFAVVVRTEIDYRRPALLGDLLTIRGWLDSLERARFWCRFEITRPADGALLVTCRQALALVEMPKAKPLRLPAAWRSQWPDLCRSNAPA